MQRLAVVLVSLCLGALLVGACAGPAESEFAAAAALDNVNKKSEAVERYLKAWEAQPDDQWGKLAKARAEVLLLHLGSQHLQTKQWGDLEKVAGHLLAIDSDSMAGNMFMGHALLGKGQLDEVESWLRKANGVPRPVTPPSDEAVEATAKALFKGAVNSARSKLERSDITEQFLTSARTGLETGLAREKAIRARCAELAGQTTEEAMATLLFNYPERPEAEKVRGPYAKLMAARLATPETIGPPTIEDPDPIATIVGALERVPTEPESQKARDSKNIEAIQTAWEKAYGAQLKALMESPDAIATYQKQHLERVDKVINDKCVPLAERLKQGDAAALAPLWEARTEAIKLIPSGLGEEFEAHARRVNKACTPHDAEEE